MNEKKKKSLWTEASLGLVRNPSDFLLAEKNQQIYVGWTTSTFLIIKLLGTANKPQKPLFNTGRAAHTWPGKPRRARGLRLPEDYVSPGLSDGSSRHLAKAPTSAFMDVDAPWGLVRGAVTWREPCAKILSSSEAGRWWGCSLLPRLPTAPKTLEKRLVLQGSTCNPEGWIILYIYISFKPLFALKVGLPDQKIS